VIDSSRSLTWDQLATRYGAYRSFPALAAGESRGSDLDRASFAARGERATNRVGSAIEKLRRLGHLPPEPALVSQLTIDTILSTGAMGLVLLRGIWDALIFDRDDYRCAYCYRSADDVAREWRSERTLLLLVGHRVPTSCGGNEYGLGNAATTCWACGAVKGALPEDVFTRELLSLSKAVLRAFG
jgi:hypothetical protein